MTVCACCSCHVHVIALVGSGRFGQRALAPRTEQRGVLALRLDTLSPTFRSVFEINGSLKTTRCARPVIFAVFAGEGLLHWGAESATDKGKRGA